MSSAEGLLGVELGWDAGVAATWWARLFRKTYVERRSVSTMFRWASYRFIYSSNFLFIFTWWERDVGRRSMSTMFKSAPAMAVSAAAGA